MKAILFDIDGTLINTAGAGGTALIKAFSELFDVPQPAKVPFSGRTDRGIAAELFLSHNIDDTLENWERLRAAYLSELTIQLPLHQGLVLPGVEHMLAEFAARDDVHLGLLTGNVRGGAQAKLEYYRLFQHFTFGGYGDLHTHRDDVAREALRETRLRLNHHYRADQVWVIGDTPLDVRCARAIDARVIAVSTGIHPRSELELEKPDLLVDDLCDTAMILEQVFR